MNTTEWLVRSPLGIIALFISLIYGMASLLIVTSAGDISQENENIFTWFLVLFPVLILIAFVYLVIWHSPKLYGPSDFRSDEAFIAMIRGGEIVDASGSHSADSDGIEENSVDLGEETAPDGGFNDSSDIEADRSDTEGGAQEQDAEGGNREIRNLDLNDPSYPIKNIRVFLRDRYIVAEELAIRDLELKYRVFAKRNVALRGPSGASIQVDAYLSTSRGDVAAEIKFIARRSSAKSSIYRAFMQMSKLTSNDNGGLGGRNMFGEVVLVYDEKAVDRGFLVSCISEVRSSIGILDTKRVRVVVRSEAYLKRKYGQVSQGEIE